MILGDRRPGLLSCLIPFPRGNVTKIFGVRKLESSKLSRGAVRVMTYLAVLDKTAV